MRLHKLVIISMLVGLNFSSAFSQTDRKASENSSGVSDARSATDDKLAEILSQKQAELDALEPAAPRARPQPYAPGQTLQPMTVITPAAATSGSEDLLEEALRRKQAELDAAEYPAPRGQPVSRPAAPAAAPVIAEPAVTPANDDPLAESLRTKQAELDAKEREAARRPIVATKEQEESEKRIQKIEADIKAKQEAMQRRAASQKSDPTNLQSTKGSVYQPPVVDLSSKQGRLTELLRRYIADEITPHDYHMERAKIVAEP